MKYRYTTAVAATAAHSIQAPLGVCRQRAGTRDERARSPAATGGHCSQATRGLAGSVVLKPSLMAIPSRTDNPSDRPHGRRPLHSKGEEVGTMRLAIERDAEGLPPARQAWTRPAGPPP